MKVITIYECEICHQAYNSKENAEKCEASGRPELPSYIEVGKTLPAFGENGIVLVKIEGLFIQNNYGYPGHHDWRCYSSISPYDLSHNASSNDHFSIDAFDPRIGWDAFRYSCTLEELKTWEETMKDYGFVYTDVNEWVLGRINSWRQKLRP